MGVGADVVPGYSEGGGGGGGGMVRKGRVQEGAQKLLLCYNLLLPCT